MNTRIWSIFVPFLGLVVSLGIGLYVALTPSVSWAMPPQATSSSPAFVASSWTPPLHAYTVAVSADGLYVLDYDTLSQAGLPVGRGVGTLDPHTLRMFWMGQEIPIQVTGEDDGAFDPGDLLIFYGRGIDSLYYEGRFPTTKYTGTNIYWLSYGGPNGQRMATRDATPQVAPLAPPFSHTLHLEDRNYWYFSNRPFAHHADHWFWEWVSTTRSRSHTFALHNLATGLYTDTLTVTLLGDSEGAHHIRLYLNTALIYDDTPWSGKTPYTITTSFAQSLLQEGNNTLKIEVVNDSGYDKVYLNWIEVTYRDTYVAENDQLTFGDFGVDLGDTRFQVTGFSQNAIAIYDVSDPFNVQLLTQADITGPGPYMVSFQDTVHAQSRYLAITPNARRVPDAIHQVTHLTSSYTPADLRGSFQAEYIVITHAKFWDQALRLAQFRAGEFHVALIDVQEIYNQFNGGMMSAESIHDFLAYARQHWQTPSPQYVVLVGDGYYDMRPYKVSSLPTYIPPYLYLADPSLGETAADNRYVTLEGNDILPDMHIGRLSVNTVEEAQAFVDKIIAYEHDCSCGSWVYNTLFVSDNLEGGGGDFYAYSDAIADGYADPPTNTVKYLPSNYQVTKAYLGRTCDLDNPAYATECREMITRTLNVTGALFVNYVGHSQIQYWAAEHLMDQSLLDSLDNGTCLPVNLEMTCYTGSFHTTSAALAESETRMPEDGFVASWAPTGFGLVTGHDILEKGLFLALFHHNVQRLGAAITEAKVYLKTHSAGDEDLIDTFTLFGDPALKVKTDAVCGAVPTAVQVTPLQVQLQEQGVELTWQTHSENNILGFHVWRQDLGPRHEAPLHLIHSQPILAQHPGTGLGGSYLWTDTTAQPLEHYRYVLEVLHTDGSTYRMPATAIVTLPWGQEDPPRQ